MQVLFFPQVKKEKQFKVKSQLDVCFNDKNSFSNYFSSEDKKRAKVMPHKMIFCFLSI